MLSYSDLKPELHHGKECVVDLLDRADNIKVILNYERNQWYACQDFLDGKDCENKHGKKYSWTLWDGNFRNLRLLNRTILDVQYGDIIVYESGGKSKVLARLNDCVLLSNTNNDKVANTWYHIKELERLGCKLLNEEPTEEEVIVTMDEIAKLKGVDVKRIKVKKE